MNMQDHRYSRLKLENCSHVTLHGPCEQTWAKEDLEFAQEYILGIKNQRSPMTITVKVCDVSMQHARHARRCHMICASWVLLKPTSALQAKCSLCLKLHASHEIHKL